MVRSMTGFGRGEAIAEKRKINIEIKSVNHRYLETNIKMPTNFLYLEGDVRQTIKSRIGRGKVDVFISYENNNEDNYNVKVNTVLAKEYLDAYQKVSDSLLIDNDVRCSSIMRSPEVLKLETVDDDEEVVKELVIDATNKAIDELIAVREAEGERLKEDVISKIEAIREDVAFIESKSDLIVEEYRKKITEKVTELLDEADIDESRIVQEVIIYADKRCVDEEIVRLNSHIQAVRDTLDEEGSIGRRLDFIVQEMNRESNTILSKVTDKELSNVGIHIKTNVEKVREQIQNIE